MLGLVQRVEAAYGGDRAGLHRRHRLALGERRRRRLGLHRLPQRVLGQVLERAALPRPVVALGDAALGRGRRGAGLLLEDGPGGLPAPLQGAGHDRDEGHDGEPLGGPRRPGSTPVSSRRTPARAAGEHPGGVGRGPAVPHQDHRCHAGDRVLGTTVVPVIVDSALYRKGQRVEVDCFPHEFDKLRARGDRGRRLRLGRALQAQRGRARRRRRLVRAAPARGRGRPQGAPAAQARAVRRQPVPHPQDALVRRRGGRRRDRRDQHVRRPRLRDHGPARPRLRAALGPLAPGVRLGRPHPRPVGGGLRGLRHGGRRLHRGGRRSSRSTSTRSRHRCSRRPAPTTRRGSTCSSARSPRYAARCCRCASRCGSSPRGWCPGVEREAGPFFRDVLDHLNQAAEVVDALDALLSTAFDAHLARISVQQNDDMRKISAGVALVVVPTLIAGVYGMNFEHMPELGWLLGYPFALAADGRWRRGRCGCCSRSPAGCSHRSGSGRAETRRSRAAPAAGRRARRGRARTTRWSGGPRTAAARRSRRRRRRTPRRRQRSPRPAPMSPESASLSWKRPAASSAGIDMKKLSRVAVTRSRPRNSPTEIVAPERETPGISATAWARPIRIASRRPRSRSGAVLAWPPVRPAT